MKEIWEKIGYPFHSAIIHRSLKVGGRVRWYCTVKQGATFDSMSIAPGITPLLGSRASCKPWAGGRVLTFSQTCW